MASEGGRDVCNEPPHSQLCAVCGGANGLSLCGGCRTVWYCCRDHQKIHWTEHKNSCRAKTGNVNKLVRVNADFREAKADGPVNGKRINNEISLTTGQGTMSENYLQSDKPEAITRLADYVVNSLKNYGLCVVDKFMGEKRGTQILDEAQRMYSNGEFQEGQLASNVDNSQKKVRGDKIMWIEKHDKDCVSISMLIARLDALILACAGRLEPYFINGRTKAMIAVYPGDGRGYMRHIDNPNQDGRCVTVIYYLNKDYKKETDGGVLRIYPQQIKHKVADIEPKFDRLLFFWSDRRNPHEVLPAYRERYAITVWYFDATERAAAKERYKQQGIERDMPRNVSVPLIQEANTSPVTVTSTVSDASTVSVTLPVIVTTLATPVSSSSE